MVETSVAHLALGEVGFDVPSADVDALMRAAASARERGDWLEFRDARGRLLRVLIPPQLLLVIREHEPPEPESGPGPANDWSQFDYDV